MIKKFFVLLSMISSMSLFCEKRDFYPYQAAHRFTNKNYINGGYYLMGDIKIESENKNLSYQVTSNLLSKNRVIIPSNRVYNTFDEYKKTLEKPYEFESGKTVVFKPNELEYPTLIVHRQDDTITVFAKKLAPKEKGVKLLFNIDEFEKYMTQTWWFDNLQRLKKTDLGIPVNQERFFSFGFVIDVDNTNFFKNKKDKPLDNVFNVSAVYKDNAFKVDLLKRVFVNNVSELFKSYDKGRRKNEFIPYDDFFKGKNLIISIQAMNENDDIVFRKLLNR